MESSGVERVGGRQSLLWLWLVPLTIAAAYVVVFLAQLPRNLTELAWNSDYSSGFTIPETLVSSGPGTHMVMGSAAEWVPLWFGLLTARLPLHRPLWEAMPTLLFLATALTVGWSVLRVAGRRAALLCILIGVVVSPAALTFLLAPVAHNTVYLGTALCGAYLVWLCGSGTRGRVSATLVPALGGVALGACLASDSLLIATAAIPLTATALLAGIVRERRASVTVPVLATIAIAVPTAVITSAVMHSLGYLKETTPAHLASVQELPQRAGWLFDSLRALFNGNLGPKRPGALHAPLGLASDVVMCAALLVLVALGLAAVVALARARSRLASRPASLSPPARSVHVAYWFTSAVLICGAYLLTAETAGGSVLHEAYCGTVIFSVAAVVPLALSGGKLARWLVPAGASVYFAASLVGLSGNYLNIAGWIATYAPKITQIAQAAHVTSGYGGYGEASSLTWNTHGRVTVRPVMECETTQGPGMCDFYLVAPSAWYVPRRRNTFLLVDSQEPWLSSLPAGLGKPIKAYAFGEMRMYLYPYDIASKLGPAPG